MNRPYWPTYIVSVSGLTLEIKLWW